MVYISGLNKSISELSILLLIFLFLFYLYQKKILTVKFFYFYCFYSSTAILFNNFLINPYDMWDQMAYLNRMIMNPKINLEFNDNIFRVNFVSYLYSFFYFLYKESINSIALINKFLIIASIIFLKYKKKIENIDVLIILMIPSTIVYSSLSLKETLIASFVFITIYFFDEKKYFYLLIFLAAIFFAREQFLFFFLMNLIIIFFLNNFKNVLHSSILIVPFFLFLVVIFDQEILNFINYNKYIYTIENSGWHIFRNEELVETPKLFLNLVDNLKYLNLELNLSKIIFIDPKYKLFFTFEVLLYLTIIIFILKSENSNKFKIINTVFFLFILVFLNYLIANVFLLHRYIYLFLISYIILSRYKFNNYQRK